MRPSIPICCGDPPRTARGEHAEGWHQAAGAAGWVGPGAAGGRWLDRHQGACRKRSAARPLRILLCAFPMPRVGHPPSAPATMGSPHGTNACRPGGSRSTCAATPHCRCPTVTDHQDCSWVMLRIIRMTTTARLAVRWTVLKKPAAGGPLMVQVRRAIVLFRSPRDVALDALASCPSSPSCRSWGGSDDAGEPALPG